MASTTWLTSNNTSQSTRESVLEQNSTFAINIVKEALGEKIDLSKDTIYRTLSTCVGEVLANCESPMQQLVNRLDLSRGVGHDKFASLADELFEAENGYIILWERIVTLFAFTWVLSKQLHSDQIESSSNVSKILASYLNDKITPWILQQGGWVICVCLFYVFLYQTICNYFPFIQIKICNEFGDDTSASNKWKYFFLTGLGIGLVATYKLTH